MPRLAGARRPYPTGLQVQEEAWVGERRGTARAGGCRLPAGQEPPGPNGRKPGAGRSSCSFGRPCPFLLERPPGPAPCGARAHVFYPGRPPRVRQRARPRDRQEPSRVTQYRGPVGTAPSLPVLPLRPMRADEAITGPRAGERAIFNLSGGYCRRRFSFFFVSKTMKPP